MCLLVGCSSSTTRRRAPAPATVSLQRMLGQRIMVGFPGMVASPTLLERIRHGDLGAVILFGANISSAARARALTASLQRAASAGGNPPLLIAVDQEGGEVRRFADAPPQLSPSQMVASHRPRVAYQQGLATGRFLHGVGVNLDLAPVVDVPSSADAFIAEQGRAFAARASTVATYAGPFAAGVQAAGVAATAKHFPGLGTATVSTDDQLDVLHPTPAQLDQALVPYRELIAQGIDCVLVTTAAVPAYDPSGRPAALSARIITGLLRDRLGFKGVTITDSLAGPTGYGEIRAGALAARAGTDILLFTDDAPGELTALLAEARSGALSAASIAAAYARIVALKDALAGHGGS
jgi:beta-N-acetylhexosaminidase